MDDFDDDTIPFVEVPQERQPRRVHALPELPPEPPPHAGRYSFVNAFNAGWDAFKEHYAILLGALVSYIAIVIVAGIFASLLDSGLAAVATSAHPVLAFLTPFQWTANFLVVTPLEAGLVWLAVRAVRREPPEIGDLFNGFSSYGRVLVAAGVPALIGFVATLPGTVLFWITFGQTVSFSNANVLASMFAYLVGLLIALYFSVRLMPAQVLVLDDRAPMLSGMESLRVSWRMTEGKVLPLIGLGITLYVIGIASAMLLCLPLIFFGGPLIAVVMAGAYSLLAHERGVAPIGDYTTCPFCGYDTSATDANICPECGNIIPGSGPGAMRPVLF
ncbi:MAG: hypothetical protein DHS20C14_21520 [Phycisphaeraceae bacterium]|nr:MAG: hypothetical protein DHS20C14_21520 [Phycisphaeraceae bacterium]